MSDENGPASDESTAGVDSADRSPNRPDLDSTDAAPTGSEPNPAHPTDTMTEHDTEPSRARSHRDEHADTTDAETRPNTASGADGTTDGRRPRRVKDRDHTSPVEGPERTFDRYHEGRSVQTDGGRRPDGEEGVDEPASSATDDDAPRRRVKDRDHTSPVDGHVRTFGRGGEPTDRSK